MFGQRNAKGKREYSSTTVSMYEFRDVVGSGPLIKSTFELHLGDPTHYGSLRGLMLT